MFRSQQLRFKATAPGRRAIHTYFQDTDKPGKKDISDLVGEMQDQGCMHAIYVTRGPPTSPALQVAQSAAATIEFFTLDQLAFDLLKHEHVPRQRVLGDEEKKALLQRLDCKPDQLPRLKQSDPVARWLGLAAGTVVEVTRNADTLDEEVSYRIVVK